MKPLTKLRALVLLTALAGAQILGCRAGAHAPATPTQSPSERPTTTKEPSMLAKQPLTIDLQAHPNLQFRIDAFSVPAAARAEFEEAMRRNLTFLQSIPGFVNHMVFEKTTGPTTFDIVTIAVWENEEVVAAASGKVRAYYQSIGFDLPAMLTRLGITASIGNYRAPANLQ